MNDKTKQEVIKQVKQAYEECEAGFSYITSIYAQSEESGITLYFDASNELATIEKEKIISIEDPIDLYCLYQNEYIHSLEESIYWKHQMNEGINYAQYLQTMCELVIFTSELLNVAEEYFGKDEDEEESLNLPGETKELEEIVWEVVHLWMDEEDKEIGVYSSLQKDNRIHVVDCRKGEEILDAKDIYEAYQQVKQINEDDSDLIEEFKHQLMIRIIGCIIDEQIIDDRLSCEYDYYNDLLQVKYGDMTLLEGNSCEELFSQAIYKRKLFRDGGPVLCGFLEDVSEALRDLDE